MMESGAIGGSVYGGAGGAAGGANGGAAGSAVRIEGDAKDVTASHNSNNGHNVQFGQQERLQE